MRASVFTWTVDGHGGGTIIGSSILLVLIMSIGTRHGLYTCLRMPGTQPRGCFGSREWSDMLPSLGTPKNTAQTLLGREAPRNSPVNIHNELSMSMCTWPTGLSVYQEHNSKMCSELRLQIRQRFHSQPPELRRASRPQQLFAFPWACVPLCLPCLIPRSTQVLATMSACVSRVPCTPVRHPSI